MTPVTLARIDLHLRLCFDCDKPFGGFDVILIGDFFQFPPVQEGMSKPALYQAAVRFSRGLSLPSQAYRTGAKLFTQFQLITLNGQVRANPEYDQWLSRLRNTKIEFPINDEWLSKLKVLKKEDLIRDPDLAFTPVVVTGNAERRKIQSKMVL